MKGSFEMKIARIFRERDPTQGNIVKNALAMTSPMWAMSAYLSFALILEMVWVGQISAQALAAVAVGGTVFMSLMAPIQGVVVAAQAIVGNLVGQKNQEQLNKTVKEILIIGWLLSFILVAIGFFLGPPLLKILGTEPEVFSLGVSYLRICAIGGLITFLFWIIDGMLKSARAINIAAAIIFGMISLQIIFSYLLIFGNFGFPRMEVEGAALARVISTGSGTLIGLGILISGKFLIKLDFTNWRRFKIRPQTFKEVIKIAFPDTLEGISRTVIHMVMFGIVAFWGTPAVVVYGIGQRILRMCSILSRDLGKTTTITVSNNLGASKIQRAEKASWVHSGMNALLVGGVGLILFILAGQVIGIFNQAPEILEIGVDYLRITTFAGGGYAIYGGGMILSRAFAGAKNTRTPMFVYWLMAGIQIGLAFLAKYFGLGINGVWFALLIGMIFYGLVLAILFKIGHRKPKKII